MTFDFTRQQIFVEGGFACDFQNSKSPSKLCQWEGHFVFQSDAGKCLKLQSHNTWLIF